MVKLQTKEPRQPRLKKQAINIRANERDHERTGARTDGRTQERANEPIDGGRE